MFEISLKSLNQKNINSTQNTVNSIKCFQTFDWYVCSAIWRWYRVIIPILELVEKPHSTLSVRFVFKLQSNLTLRPDVRDSFLVRGHQDIERNFSKLLIFLREAFNLRLPQKLRESRQMHEVLIGWMNRECQKTGPKWIYTRWQNYRKVSLLHSSTHAEFRALHSKRHSKSYKVKSEEERRGEEERYISITLLVSKVCKSVSRSWAWTSWTPCGNCISVCVWCETKETGLVFLMRNKCQHIQWHKSLNT